MIRNIKMIRAGINVVSMVTVLMVGLMACDSQVVAPPPQPDIRQQEEIKRQKKCVGRELRSFHWRWLSSFCLSAPPLVPGRERTPVQDNEAPAVQQVRRLIKTPIPLAPPTVDKQLTRLPAIERITEVCRYTLQRTEFWVSPGGWLREYLRLNAALALLIGLPALLVLPVVTLIIHCTAGVAAVLAAICTNLLIAAQTLGHALMWFGGIYLAVRIIGNARKPQR